MKVETSQIANLWALGVVAFWRVSLFIFFVMRGTRMTFWRSSVGVLFVLCPMVVVLGLFSFASTITIDQMAGTRAVHSTPVQVVTKNVIATAFFAFWPLFIAFAYFVRYPIRQKSDQNTLSPKE